MHHIHLIHWLADFLGINNTYDSFSTHMYNFWSGFGGNISVLALIGALFGIYRHNLSRLDRLNPINIVRTPLRAARSDKASLNDNNNQDEKH